jgi:hypothetical protein
MPIMAIIQNRFSDPDAPAVPRPSRSAGAVWFPSAIEEKMSVQVSDARGEGSAVPARVQ